MQTTAPTGKLALLAAIFAGSTILAASATDLHAASTETSACKNSRALGVSRVIKIDTSKETHFGHQQYKDAPDLLRDGEVVLTFDDGPLRRRTRKVLKALERHCTKATFFTVGRMAIADPPTLRAVAAAGHTIGHHTWSHRNQKSLSLSRAIAEFELGVSAVEAVIGRPSAPFFRFPYLADASRMQRYMVQRKFGIFSIDIDSYDWRSKSADAVISQVMRKLKSKRKGIVLFHDIQAATANSIDRLLDRMHTQGFKIVHFVPKTNADGEAQFQALPEYKQEAVALLQKKNFRKRARPRKTAFRFSDPGPRRRRTQRASGSASSRNRSTTPTRASVTANSPAARPAVRRPAAAARRPAAVARRPAARQPAKPKLPDWRDTIFSR